MPADETIAVMLDLADPERPVRHRMAEGRKARLDTNQEESGRRAVRDNIGPK